jgi:hypothetical protein
VLEIALIGTNLMVVSGWQWSPANQCTDHVKCPKEQSFRLMKINTKHNNNLSHPNESRIIDSEGPMFIIILAHFILNTSYLYKVWCWAAKFQIIPWTFSISLQDKIKVRW